MYLIHGSVGAEALFFPIRRRIKKKGKGIEAKVPYKRRILAASLVL